MRNYIHIDHYYSELLGDLYRQPEEPLTTGLAQQVVMKWVSQMSTCRSVLDVGCGEGFLQPVFDGLNIAYTGIAMGEDVLAAKQKGRNVLNMDFNFLEFPDNSFDLIFSRHSLEHSPFPLLTLMEWNRVAKAWLCLITPKPEIYGWDKPNHYSIATKAMVVNWMQRSGWMPMWYGEDNQEHRWMCEKKNRFFTDKDNIALGEPPVEEEKTDAG